MQNRGHTGGRGFVSVALYSLGEHPPLFKLSIESGSCQEGELTGSAMLGGDRSTASSWPRDGSTF